MSSKIRTAIGSMACVVTLLTSVGCSSPKLPETQKIVQAEPEVVAVERQPPPGVERMCWVEPEVALESNGPGVDAAGRWYHPSYKAVRQVRGGYWRPCREVKN